MTDDSSRNPDDEPIDRDPPDDWFEPEPGPTVLSRLFELLEALENREAGSQPEYDPSAGGRTERNDGGGSGRSPFAFDLDVSIGSLDISDLEGDRVGTRSSTTTGRSSHTEIDALEVTTRRYGTELEVVSDVSSLGQDTVRVGVDDGDLVIAADDRPLSRVELPWSKTTERASMNNGILTVRVTRADTPPSSGEING